MLENETYQEMCEATEAMLHEGASRIALRLFERVLLREGRKRLTKNVRSTAKYTLGSIRTGTAIRFPAGAR